MMPIRKLYFTNKRNNQFYRGTVTISFKYVIDYSESTKTQSRKGLKNGMKILIFFKR
jgi:hypothetical protein